MWRNSTFRMPISFAIAQSADDPDFGTLPSYVPDSTSPTAADQNKTTKPPADKGKVTTKGCFGNPLMGQSLINFDGCAALVANLIMWLAARVLWLSGGILNIAIGRTLDMAGLLHDLPIESAREAPADMDHSTCEVHIADAQRTCLPCSHPGVDECGEIVAVRPGAHGVGPWPLIVDTVSGGLCRFREGS